MQKELLSEVAGTVWKVLRQAGDSVQNGDEIIIVESMKMEIPVTAPAAGVLASIDIAEGDVVAENQVLATLRVA